MIFITSITVLSVYSLFGNEVSHIESAGLITNNPLHIDSFLFDLIVFSIVDMIIKLKYDILSKKGFLLKVVLSFIILLAAISIMTAMLSLEV